MAVGGSVSSTWSRPGGKGFSFLCSLLWNLILVKGVSVFSDGIG